MSIKENKKISSNEVDVLKCEEAIYSEEYIDIILPNRNISDILLKYNTLCYQIIDERNVIVHYKFDRRIEDLLDIDIHLVPNAYGPYGTSSVLTSGILKIHNNSLLKLEGEGVLTGFIDSGIEYTHPAFINEENGTRIVSIWDQTIRTGKKPINFMYGSEYNKEEINQALKSQEPYSIVPSKDELGHGTFIAGVASGSKIGDYKFVGAAPKSEIIMVKLKPAKQYLRYVYSINNSAIIYQDTDIIMGIKYLLQKAIELKKPISICIGLGTNQGAHDGTALLESYIIQASSKTGVIVTVAGGNEANLAHHYLGEYNKDEEYQDVEFKIASGEKSINMQMWAKTPDFYTIALLSPLGEYVSRITPKLNLAEKIDLLLENTKIFIEYNLLEAETGDQFIRLKIDEPTEGVWTIRVFGEVVVVGRYDIWLGREGWNNPDTVFLQPDPHTTVTVPSTTIVPITVGAYNHEFNSMSVFSGRGLARDEEMKPDLVAPGVNVIGPVLNGDLGIGTGTSIAAAHVAGAVALLLEWGIVLGNLTDMDTIIAKKALIRGADRKEQLIYPNRQWGYGSLNLFNAFQILVGKKAE